MPKEKDSPGQKSLFDKPQGDNPVDGIDFDFKLDLSSVANLPFMDGRDRAILNLKLARDRRVADAIKKARKIPGEAGRAAQAKIVSAQVEMMFDDMQNFSDGIFPNGYRYENFVSTTLFNGLHFELSGKPSDWIDSTATLEDLNELPPHVIASFKERRKRREQGIVRRMAVAANNLKTLIDPKDGVNFTNPTAIEGLDKIRIQPKDSLLTEGANGYFSSAGKRIGIIVENCYNDMFHPGKSKTKGFEELNEWFSDVSPEGVMIHELGHAINCDNLYKADLANFARRREVTDFWSAWDETFMSRPFKNNLKSLASSKGETSYTKQLKAAFPDIAKEHVEVSRRISGKTPDEVTPEERKISTVWGGFIEYWNEAMKREAGGVSQYARTCPAELVAEMFASPRPMNEFSKTLQTYYKLNGGPDFDLSNHKKSSDNAA